MFCSLRCWPLAAFLCSHLDNKKLQLWIYGSDACVWSIALSENSDVAVCQISQDELATQKSICVCLPSLSNKSSLEPIEKYYTDTQ